MTDDQPEVLQVPLVWIGAEETPVLMANQALGQVAGDNELVLSFGQVVPPPLLGSPEERMEQAKRIEFVQVRVVARISLTRTRLVELQQVLQDTMDNYDTSVEGTTPE